MRCGKEPRLAARSHESVIEASNPNLSKPLATRSCQYQKGAERARICLNHACLEIERYRSCVVTTKGALASLGPAFKRVKLLREHHATKNENGWRWGGVRMKKCAPAAPSISSPQEENGSDWGRRLHHGRLMCPFGRDLRRGGRPRRVFFPELSI